MTTLVLYTRPGCGLCHDLVDALEAGFGDAVDLELRDVDSQPDWKARYGWDIPVLTTQDGTELCRHALDTQAVARCLKAPLSST